MEEFIRRLLNVENDRYVMVTWPDVQSLFELNGFQDNAYLVDAQDPGCLESAYFVSVDWLKQWQQK